jgi:hypothetical protein
MKITIFKSLYDIDQHHELNLTWPEIAERLATYTTLLRKENASLFGPFSLKTLLEPCELHNDGIPRYTAHRCTLCISEISLLVFDADKGEPGETERLLEEDDIARHWYSSYNHSPDKSAYRLVLPLVTPITDLNIYKMFRKDILEKYKIPANEKECSGPSHTYFLPSNSGKHYPHYWTAGHCFLKPPEIKIKTRSIKPANKPAKFPGQESLSTSNYRKKLTKLVTRLQETSPEKSQWLDSLLFGVSIAPDGNRYTSTLRLTGMLAWRYPEMSEQVLEDLFEGSLSVMKKAGSKLTMDKIHRFFSSAARRRELAEQQQDLEWQDRLEIACSNQ